MINTTDSMFFDNITDKSSVSDASVMRKYCE